jgi:hypothetical protein
LSVLGLAGARAWAGRTEEVAIAPVGGFGRAKRCIFLFMWGGPSQLDTFDLKPHAPAEVRGEFQPIDTVVPGMQICEHFTQLAQHTDKLAILRSLHHNDPAHLSSGHHILTGHLAPNVRSDKDPPSDRDTPHLGSLLAHLRPTQGTLPGFVTLPWVTSHPAAPGGQAPGQTGGFLGKARDPLVLKGDPNDPQWGVPELVLRDGLSLSRLESRRQLLEQVDAQRDALKQAAESGAFGGYQQRAIDLVAGAAAREAFDLTQESAAMRERYGRNIHGQCVLLARRLVERQVPIVSVNWHDDGRNFWDTHGDNFRRLKRDLIPPTDRALAALLGDLSERGLLDETLVVWVGEFGRRPQITRGNAGREHWPFCFSGLLAGGGIRGGQVYGASDNIAARPAERPVNPGAFIATVFHALGVASDAIVHDVLGRPHPVYAGAPVSELFG